MGGMVSTVGGLLGGTSNNANFVATTSPLTSPVTGAQATQAYNTAQGGIQQQQDLATQLAAQGGLGNQTNLFGQQQGLASQLQNQSLGQGPNPAQAQYSQNINAGTQAAAGTIASQKGISPALAAQLIAQQQGSANQNAAGSAATLQAQQQLAAQQQLGQQQAQMQGVAANQIGNQIGGVQGLNTAAQGEQGTLLNSIANVNQSNVAAQNNANTSNASMAATNANNSAGFVNNLMFGKSGGGAATGAKGGEVNTDKITPPVGQNSIMQTIPSQKYADGGQVNNIDFSKGIMGILNSIGASSVAMNNGGIASDNQVNVIDPSEEQQKSNNNVDNVILKAYRERTNGKNPEGQETRESLLQPDKLANGGAIVPGQPKVDKNSVKNDVVPVMLTPKEIVLPLSVTQAKDPAEEARKFVQALQDKKGKDSSGDGKEEFKSALKKAISNRKK